MNEPFLHVNKKDPTDMEELKKKKYEENILRFKQEIPKQLKA